MNDIATRAEKVIDRFIAALEAGDARAAVACYAPNARIWHNFDQIEMTPAENIASIEQFVAVLPQRRYSKIKRHVLPTGFVQQHVIVGVTRSGKEILWPGCIVFEMLEDRIVHLEEYVDIESLTKQLT